MPDISFHSFNARSFEQFAQALVAGVMGPGTFIFGDGPDGGREAEFNGKISYPGRGTKWNGRTTMQAKFRQRPNDGKDPEWLIGQLTQDALAMQGNAPDYYIVITNVRLSGVQSARRKGGQQKLQDFFETNLQPLGIREMHVWHEEKIASLLDHQSELFRSYRSWLSPREVLSAIYDQITDQIPNFSDSMYLMLQRDLREQRSAKLSQAGHLDDTPIALDAVFVDLPYTIPDILGVEGIASLYSQINSPTSGMLLQDILEFTSLKLDPFSRSQSRGADIPQRFLVMGGPGQGKSTIGQFLAQIARVRLLQGKAISWLTPETTPIMENISHHVTGLGLSTSGPPRYPILIDLPTYADNLSEAFQANNRLPLLAFIAKQIKDSASIERLDLTVLRRWMATQPWLIVLDGLDEVPPSANRREVLIEIERFWDEVAATNADLAMVISSRPQGYNDDLDPKLYRKLEMVRLTPEHALAYAEKLAAAKIPTNERQTVMSRMHDAASNNSTQLLMISPLQVAIMIQIAGLGVPSSNRWELFDEYRQVIVRRELGKRGKGSETLRKHKNVINLVLRRAGLLLHLEAEQRGGAESYLTPERLEKIAHDVLAEDQIEGDKLLSGPAEIVALATDRLVLLEQRIEGRIAFEVRSLQEYLAAAELMSGGDAEVSDRIRQIAGLNHWSHVFRIAAAKAFADSDARKYRDTIMTAIDSIDSDPAAAASQRASSVAIELVLDGVAHQHHGYLRILVNKAFSHLALGPSALDNRFSSMLASIEPQFRDPLKVHVGSDNPAVRSAAWAVLLKAIRQRGNWADKIAIQMWPTEHSQALSLAAYDILDGSLAHSRMMAEYRSSSVGELVKLKGSIHRSFPGRNDPLLNIVGPLVPENLRIGILGTNRNVASIRVMDLETSEETFGASFLSDHQSDFRPLSVFARNPGSATLAGIVRSWKDVEIFQSYRNMTIPWPVSTMSSMISGGEEIELLATAIEGGEFADVDDWRVAEMRWKKSGLTAADLAYSTTGKFFGQEVATVGSPSPSYVTWHTDKPVNQPWAHSIVSAAESATGSPRALWCWLACLAMSRTPINPPLSGERFAPLLVAADGWLGTAVVKSCEPADISQDEVKSALSGCKIWMRDESQDLSQYPETQEQLLMLIDDPKFDEFLLNLATGDWNFSKWMSKAPKIDIDSQYNPNRLAIGLLQKLVDIDDAVPAISRDPSAGTAQSFILSREGRIGFNEDEDIKILSILANGGLTVIKRYEAIRQLASILDSHSSRLSDAGVWFRLNLPRDLFSMIHSSNHN